MNVNKNLELLKKIITPKNLELLKTVMTHDNMKIIKNFASPSKLKLLEHIPLPVNINVIKNIISPKHIKILETLLSEKNFKLLEELSKNPNNLSDELKHFISNKDIKKSIELLKNLLSIGDIFNSDMLKNIVETNVSSKFSIVKNLLGNKIDKYKKKLTN